MKLLEKSRKLNKLLQERDTAQYQEIANLMSNLIEANIYIVGNKGDVKAYSLREEFACKFAKEVVLDNGNFPAEYVQFLMGIKETYANIPHLNHNCTFRGNEKCLFANKKTTVVPIFGNGERLGTLIVSKADSDFNDDDLRRLKIFLLKIKQHLTGMVDGIFYYDIALVHLKEKYDLPFELVWAQEHMTNNYLTCNYWYSKGVKYAQLSNELMLSEIKEIHEHTDMQLVYQVFGYIPMFTSKRPLLSNYIDTYQLYRQGKDYNLYKEEKYYPIVENRDGTVLYTPYMLNALEEYMELRDSGVLRYAILNGYLLKHNVFKRIVGIFHGVNEKNLKELSLEIDQLCKYRTDKGFLYKETVYKVKDYGKEKNSEKA